MKFIALVLLLLIPSCVDRERELKREQDSRTLYIYLLDKNSEIILESTAKEYYSLHEPGMHWPPSQRYSDWGNSTSEWSWTTPAPEYAQMRVQVGKDQTFLVLTKPYVKK